MLQVLTYSNFFLLCVSWKYKVVKNSTLIVEYYPHMVTWSFLSSLSVSFNFLFGFCLVPFSIYVSFSSLVLFLDLMTAVRGFWNPQILTTSQGYLEKIFFYSLHNAMLPVNPQWHWIMVTSTLTQFQQYSDPLTFMIDVQWHVSV